MENIDIKLVLDEVFGKSCDSIVCDTCKYKEDCNLLNKFINDIKDKGLSPDQYVRGLALFVYVIKEQKYLNDFGKTQEDIIIKLATENGFELNWLINRWNSVIDDKDILKPIIAIFPKYAKDMIINAVEANTKINNFIAQHIIDTSNAEYKEMIKMVNESANNKQENKFKNVSDDEIYAELKRRKANKSVK
jgi:hypothetical protein